MIREKITYVLCGANAAWMGKELPDGVLGGIIRTHSIGLHL